MNLLRYHTNLLPVLTALQGAPHPGEDETDPGAYARDLQVAREAIVFDCRGLSFDFIYDTGSAVYAEMVALNRPARLPAASCWFEFKRMSESRTGGVASCGVLATEIVADGGIETIWFKYFFDFQSLDVELLYPPSARVKPPTGSSWNTIERAANLNNARERMFRISHYAMGGFGAFCFDRASGEVFYKSTDTDKQVSEIVMAGGVALLGILALLDEKLVASKFVADPAPRLTKARMKSGKLPVTSDHHVVDLDIAAVRRESRDPTGTHESPCLHWRRGHWRTLRKGSRTWIRRCLVGDPSRGYLETAYRMKDSFAELINAEKIERV